MPWGWSLRYQMMNSDERQVGDLGGSSGASSPRSSASPGHASDVRKVGYFGPVSPDGQGDRQNYCVPMLRFLLSPRSQTMSQNELRFTLEMPDCCLNLLFLPRGRTPPPPVIATPLSKLQ